jgi:hypothetical protein
MGLQSVPTIDQADRIASALEYMAADIRAGRTPFGVRKCLVVVAGPDSLRADNVGLMHFGSESSMIEVVGMLELAKIQAIEDEG